MYILVFFYQFYSISVEPADVLVSCFHLIELHLKSRVRMLVYSIEKKFALHHISKRKYMVIKCIPWTVSMKVTSTGQNTEKKLERI